jgi:N-acylneuraminate cytidylyltransferase
VYQKENYDSLFNTRNHQKIRKITGTKFEPFNYTIGQRSQDLDPFVGIVYITKAD